MNLYERQFSSDLDIPRAPEVRKTLIIASTPRCGSHMLGHSMLATQALGVPFEYLNRANAAEWQRRLSTGNLPETLAMLIRRRTTPNGVFSVKLHYNQCETIGGIHALRDLLPGARFILIRRADVLRQAISYAIAQQTGVWISEQEPVLPTAHYDFDQITACLRDIAWQNSQWETALTGLDGGPLRIDFDDLKEDPGGTIRRIVDWAGVEIAGHQIPDAAPTRRQSVGAHTTEWIARFAKDMQSRRRTNLTVRVARRLTSGWPRLG